MGKKKHEKGAGSTPATVQHEQAGIPFKTYEYAHSNDHMDDGYGVEAALNAALISSAVTSLFRTVVSSVTEPSGTWIRWAWPCSLPFTDGTTLPIALAPR